MSCWEGGLRGCGAIILDRHESFDPTTTAVPNDHYVLHLYKTTTLITQT